MTKETRQILPPEGSPHLNVHDSMQQHIFALAMQVGTLKLLLKRNPEAALETLQEIEQLVQLTQLDLNALKSLRSRMEISTHATDWPFSQSPESSSERD